MGAPGQNTVPPVRNRRGRWAQIRILQTIIIGACLFAATSQMVLLDADKKAGTGTSTKERVLVFSNGGDNTLENVASERKSTEPWPSVAASTLFNASSTLRGEFVYANRTYRYSYSTRFHQRFKPTKGGLLPTGVFGVISNGAKPRRRMSIRNSWGKKVVVFFMVAGDWETISGEFDRFGDLIWIDTPEDYRYGLTPKTFGFIHMAVTQLIRRPDYQVDYIFKTDDDVFVNATEMSLEMDKYGMPEYYGIRRADQTPVRVVTNKTKKWLLSKEEYPADLFPTYAHGVGYALGREFANCAVRQMPSMLLMPWEDVATGILANKCNVDVTPANDEWRHLLPFSDPESGWNKFPFEDYKDGGVLVKILHRVFPWFYAPLSKQASLQATRDTIMRKRKEVREHYQKKKKAVKTA